MVKEIASYNALGLPKARLIDLEGVLRLEIYRDEIWSCEWQSAANGLLNRKSGLRIMNQYIKAYEENFLGLELVS